MRTLYGVNPVRELLRAGGDVPAELWLTSGERSRALSELAEAARARGAKVREAPRDKLDRLAGTDRHQGVVAVVSDYRYRELDELLEAARAAGAPPLLVVLDGIEDPQNLGAVIRSAHALGAHGVVIPKDRAAGVTPAAAKASAGAVEHCPVARVTNLAQALERLKEAGVWTVATDAAAEESIAEVDLTVPTALVIGSEGGGVRPLVRRTCDRVARIPMQGKVGSLNASASAAIALYEVLRQRGRAKNPAAPRA
ncbi:23S rRNA (guanosine(2251)-2'-O)-methyltransferase RlmB [Anaeromyxobacter diazotrophicus]|uniref:23S rRNA (Guanosine(2251)-2'-O)-methyltransferase RlmB n=1 Tax=Anaeromyxobacter diazotrophicus TaxID=2590199 RepID=A0A7I9VMB6_9BACT|nr:23S rRNA (guanosine(2251)-2'-O)-methyltransferase RlmB [Anaeromyxobacter diazotrophicus]GEJ57269.1 23S rRNA (guanosine(2251)-2'-O)-methyltransferase RlmB [Anaeromyxobacter diazotrophicus]